MRDHILVARRKVLIWQSECIHRVSTCTYNVLFPIYSVTDRATRIGTAQVDVPQRLACCRIECYKVAVHPTSEHQAAGSGEHATLRIVNHLEVPLLLARFRIDGPDCAVPELSAQTFCTFPREFSSDRRRGLGTRSD